MDNNKTDYKIEDNKYTQDCHQGGKPSLSNNRQVQD